MLKTVLVNEVSQFSAQKKTNQKLENIAQNEKEESKKEKESEETLEELNARIGKLISGHSFMLFMKGTPDEPKCKFSRRTIELLKAQKIGKFGFFNILNDPEVRAQIKVYSNWKTFPQLYINGKLIGGLDVMKELVEEGEFQAMVPNECKEQSFVLFFPFFAHLRAVLS